MNRTIRSKIAIMDAYENLVQNNLVCQQCGRGVGVTFWCKGKRVCYTCRNNVAPVQRKTKSKRQRGERRIHIPLRDDKSMRFETGEEVSVDTLRFFSDISVIGAAVVLVKLKNEGVLKRTGTLRYRVVKPVRFLRETGQCT